MLKEIEALWNAGKECQPDCDSGTTTTRTRHLHYLNIAGMTIGAHIVDSQSGGTGTQYWYKDHLGSVAAVTNDASPNAPCERAAYDAYGQRNASRTAAARATAHRPACSRPNAASPGMSTSRN